MTAKSISLVAAILACSASGAALAKPIHITNYTYYTVGGDTAQEIYKSMLRKGPRVNGAKAYAATSATTSQDGKLLQGASCSIGSLMVNWRFKR